MLKSNSRRALASVSLFLAITCGGAAAATTSLHATIDLSLRGIGFGKLKHGITVKNNTYNVSGSVETNTLVSLVADTSGSFSATGTINGSDVTPGSHTVSYKRRKKKGYTKISFKGDMVQKTSASPPVRYKPTVVKVTAEHLRKVVDPISALVVTVDKGQENNGRAVCNRRIPIFDGKERYDVAFSYVRSKKARTRGFSGQVFTCKVRYIPVAGHRPEKKSVQKLARNNTIRVSLARVGNTNVFALYGFEAMTDVGMARGKAYKFKLQ